MSRPPKVPQLPRDLEFLLKKRSEIDHAILAGTLEGSGDVLYLNPAERSVHTYIVGVSGSGKSRFLQALLLQDIAKGHPLCLIDPAGDLYSAAREFVASGTEVMARRGFDIERVLERFVFLDLNDPNNSVKINPLEPSQHEKSEEQVDDLLKALERLLGRSLEEQRILRNILRGVFMMIVELNRLEPSQRPTLPESCASQYPLNLHSAVQLLLLEDDERLALINALGNHPRLKFRRQYWEFFARNTRSEQNRLVQSSWNVLQYLLDDSLTLRVLDAHTSTISIDDALRRGKSLICHLPTAQNLTGTPFLGRYLTTKLERAAKRRPEVEWANRYYLYVDEFQHFVDQSFAMAMTDLRKYGLILTNAHQSQSQPPFDTAEGRALLSTIKGNSRIKVVFRLDRPDAEEMSKELREVTAPKLSHYSIDRSESFQESLSWNHVFSFQITEGTAHSWSRSQATSLGRTQTVGIGQTFGTNIGQTLTRAIGGSVAEGLAEAISRSESRGITEAFNESLQMSVAIGTNWAQIRDHRRGLTLTRGENDTFAVQEGYGRDLKVTQQEGRTDTSGRSTGQSQGDGETLTLGHNGGVSYYSDGSYRTTSGQSDSTAAIRNASSTQEENFSRAISTLRGLSQGLSESRSLTHSRSNKLDFGLSESEGASSSEGGSRQETTGSTRSRQHGHSHEVGESETQTRNVTETRNWQDAAANAFSLLDQVSKTYSEALQQSWTDTQGVSLTEKTDFSRGEQAGRGEAISRSLAKTRKEVYFTLDERRELLTNELQKLGDRQAFIATEALKAQLIRTIEVPDQHYDYRAHDFPSLMIEMQRARLLPPSPLRLEDPAPENLLAMPEQVRKEVSTDQEAEPEASSEPPPERDEDDPFLD